MPENLSGLLNDKNRKILFVGIGNLLRSDDGAGVYITCRIRETERIKAITPEVSIENYIGRINSIDHNTMILIDCADIGKNPGEYQLLHVSQIMDMTFNTHNISLSRLSDFFSNETLILAIQPETIAFGENLSYIVLEACKKIINLINDKTEQNGD